MPLEGGYWNRYSSMDNDVLDASQYALLTTFRSATTSASGAGGGAMP